MGSRSSLETLIFLGTLVFALAANVATTQLPAGWAPYLWVTWVICGVVALSLIALHIVAHRNQTHSERADGSPTVVIGHENRRRLIEAVRGFWIREVLDKSLAKIIQLELELMEDRSLVEGPWNWTYHGVGSTPRVLPRGTPIGAIFREAAEALLILGAPGAGKTTLLLELASELLQRATEDPDYPVPAVFLLSSWSAKPRALQEWLADELHERYRVKLSSARTWVEDGAILPLLDGLDEVPPHLRDRCVSEINDFRASQHLLPMVISSRTVDYEGLADQLSLGNAVMILPLARSQVNDVLDKGGDQLAAARAALARDPRMWDVLDNPLMLSIFILAYRGKRVLERTPLSMTAAGIRDEFISEYVTAMFARHGAVGGWTIEAASQGLTWIARELRRRKQTLFTLRSLDNDSLHRFGQIVFMKYVWPICLALVCASIGFFYITVILQNHTYFPIKFSGFVFINMIVFFFLLNDDVGAISSKKWDWYFAIGLIPLAFVSALFYYWVGLMGWFPNPFGLGILISGPFSVVLIFGFRTPEISTSNEDLVSTQITRIFSQSTALAVSSFLLAMAINGYHHLMWLEWLGAFAIFLLSYGGYGLISHFLLRAIVYFECGVPFYLERFLDAQARQIILLKAGDGYIFLHQMVADYFADLDTGDTRGT